MNFIQLLHISIRHKALTLALLFFSTGAIAQSGPGGSEDLGSDPDSSVPVDGGISLLLAVGVAYGFKSLNKPTISGKKSEK